MDLIGRAGHLQEAAVLLAGTGIPCAELQSVLDLGAGDRHQAGHVAEGADRLAGHIGPVAGGDVGADAAAVHDGDVTAELLDLVEVGVDAVGHQVAHVGLLRADEAVAGDGVVDVEVDGALGDLLAQHVVHRVDPVGLEDQGLVEGVDVAGGDQLGGEVAVGVDGHAAHVAQIAAGLGQDDGVALGVADGLAGHLGVGVAVDERIEADGVLDDLTAGPGRGGAVHAQVAQADDKVGVQPCLVDGLLDGVVELLAVVAAVDAVDVLVLAGVHEVGGGGLGDGLGGGHTDEGQDAAAAEEVLDGGQHLFAGAQVLEVAADVGEVGLFVDDLQDAVHAVVELVVAQSGQVIAGGVHQLDDGGALVHGAIGGALDVVAGVQQQDVHAGVLVALLEGLDGGVGQLRSLVVDVGVYVVGVQDGDGVFFRRDRGIEQAVRTDGGGGNAQGGGCAGQSAGRFQEITARNIAFHRNVLLILLTGMWFLPCAAGCHDPAAPSP